jgi:type I restriction enzyme M protein
MVLKASNKLDSIGNKHADTFRKDDDVRWQPSGAGSTAKGSPQVERVGVYQFGVPPKGNANFAWVQHFIHHLAPQGITGCWSANMISKTHRHE